MRDVRAALLLLATMRVRCAMCSPVARAACFCAHRTAAWRTSPEAAVRSARSIPASSRTRHRCVREALVEQYCGWRRLACGAGCTDACMFGCVCLSLLLVRRLRGVVGCGGRGFLEYRTATHQSVSTAFAGRACSIAAAGGDACVLRDVLTRHPCRVLLCPQRGGVAFIGSGSSFSSAHSSFTKNTAEVRARGSGGAVLRLAPPCLWRRFCLLYTSPSPRDGLLSRMPSSA